jgi:hypothetical protein
MATADQQPPRRPAETRAHPVHRFTGRLNEVIDTIDSARVWTMSPGELAESMRESAAAQAKLAELNLALIAQADRSDLPAHEAAPSLVA